MTNLKTLLIAGPGNNYHPPVLSYKAFIGYGLALLLLRLLLGAIPAQSSAVDSGVLMKLINTERTQRNLTSLIAHSSLAAAASQKAQDMIDRDYFAHIDPDGNYVWGKIVAAGYTPYRILGENLALDFSTSEGMIKAWLDSPTHRANLLHTEFVNQGLSAVYGDYQGRYTNLTASLFGALVTTPKPSPPSPLIKGERPATAEIPPSPPLATTTPSGNTVIPKNNSTQPRINPFFLSRMIFTFFGGLLLLILLVDSVIIQKHLAAADAVIPSRSHSSYHLSTFIFIVLVSILIWWW